MDLPELPDVRLQGDEHVVRTFRRSGWPVTLRTIVTLGLYTFWWRAGLVVLTDQRILMKQGVLNKSELSLPLRFVQDAAMHRSWLGVGHVTVSTAGARDGDATLHPFSAVDARALSDAIVAHAHASWTSEGPPARPDAV
jgi:hypothetical protein